MQKDGDGRIQICGRCGESLCFLEQVDVTVCGGCGEVAFYCEGECVDKEGER